nr:hypothetical protein HK105_006449 [Polyrhizophydium stewartii]
MSSAHQPQQTQDEPLRLGDEIVLQSETAGALCTDGCGISWKCLVKPRSGVGSGDVRCDDPLKSVFRVEPLSQYGCLKAFRKFASSVKTLSGPTSEFGDQELLLDTLPDPLAAVCPAGVSPLDAATWDELRREAKAEKRQNEEELARLLGKPVVYGQIVQLRSVYAQKWVSVNSKETCSHESISMRVGADGNVRKESLFRVLPRYKIRAEGETVRVRDVVVLQSVKTENYLSVGRIFHSVDPSAFPAGGENRVGGTVERARVFDDVSQPGFFEASAALQPHGWLVHRFDSHQRQSSKRIRAGQYVRFYHKEKEGYLSAELREDRVHLFYHQLNPLHPKDTDSASTFWQIVHQNEFQGGEFATAQLVRLRHVSTNTFLEVDGTPLSVREQSPSRFAPGRISGGMRLEHANGSTTNFSLAAMGGQAGGDGTPPDLGASVFASAASSAPHTIEFAADIQPQIKRLRVRLVDSHPFHSDPTTDPTLFVLHPVNVDSDDHLCLSSFFRIQNCRTGTWLHAAATQATTATTLLSLDRSSPSISSIDPTIKNSRRHRLVALVSNRGDDYFSISRVEEVYSSAFNFVSGMALPLEYWLMRPRIPSAQSKARFPLTARGEKKTKRVLTALIYHATRSAEVDPFKRKTNTIQLHQRYLRESGMIDIAVCMLEIPISLEKRRAVRQRLCADFALSDVELVHPDEVEVTLDDLAKGSEPRLTAIFRLIYSLLQVFLIGADESNQLYLARDFDTIAQHIKLRLGATDTLMQLVSSNRAIIDAISTDQIDFFIELIGREKRASFLDFLIALCHVNGQPVSKHQAYIASRLVQSHRSSAYLFRTSLVKADLNSTGSNHEVVIQLPSMPDRGREAQRMPLHIFCHSMSEEHKSGLVAFFRNSLVLFEALCRGHNQFCVDVIVKRLKLITLHTCIAGVADKRINEAIRAQFCNLMRVMFVDAFPVTPVLQDYVFLCGAAADYAENSDPSGTLTPSPLRAAIPIDFIAVDNWLNSFLEENDWLIVDKRERNQLIVAALSLLRSLVSYGFYTSHQQILQKYRIVCQILDPRTDALDRDHVRNIQRSNSRRYDLWTSSDLTDSKSDIALLIRAKIVCLRILDVFFNIRAETRSQMLSGFWTLSNDDSARISAEPIAQNSPAISPSSSPGSQAAPTQIGPFLDHMMTVTSFDEGEDKLTPRLLDLLRVPNTTLRKMALKILHRVHSNAEELFTLARRSLLLPSVDDARAHVFVQRQVTLFALASAKLHGAYEIRSAQRAIQILRQFGGLCTQRAVVDEAGAIQWLVEVDQEPPKPPVTGQPAPYSAMPSPTIQRILRNLGMHALVFELIETLIPFITTSTQSHLGTVGHAVGQPAGPSTNVSAAPSVMSTPAESGIGTPRESLGGAYQPHAMPENFDGLDSSVADFQLAQDSSAVSLPILLTTALEFLRDYTTDNRELQSMVFANLDMLMACASKIQAISTKSEAATRAIGAITAILSANMAICLKITEAQVRAILDYSRGTHSEWLSLLWSIVKVKGNVLKRNQNLVMKCLQERPDMLSISAIMNLVRLKPDAARTAAQANGVSSSLDSLLELNSDSSRFQIVMLDLWAVCGEGENRFCQSVLQNLVNSTQTLMLMTSPFASFPLKRAATRFFLSIHLFEDLVDRMLLGFVEAVAAPHEAQEEPMNVSIPQRRGTTMTNFSTHSPSRALSTNSFLETRKSQRMWDYLSDICAFLGSVSQTGVFESQEERSYFIDAILPFVDRLYSLLNSNDLEEDWLKDASELSKQLLDLLVATSHAATAPDPILRRRLANALNTMTAVAKITGKSAGDRESNETVDVVPMEFGRRPRRPFPPPIDVYDVSRQTQQVDSINTGFLQFLARARTKPEIGSMMDAEFAALCKYFEFADSKKDRQSNQAIQSLIQHLVDTADVETLTSMLIGGEQSLHDQTTSVDDDRFDVRTLLIIEVMVARVIKEQNALSRNLNPVEWEVLDKRRTKLQNQLDSLGCTTMAERLMTSRRRPLIRAASRLMIMLLHGGNKQVQMSLWNFWLSTREERFFYCVHEHIRQFILHLNETKQTFEHNLRREERKTSRSLRNMGRAITRMDSITSDLGAAMAPSAGADLNPKRGPSNQATLTELFAETQSADDDDADFPRDLMRLLQLFAEGHNHALQSYIRLQPDNIKSFDIVNDIVSYLHAVASVLGVIDLKILLQIFDTLIELSQGCVENQIAIFNAKVIPTINVILAEEFPNGAPTLVAEVKGKAVLCLLSLLEDEWNEDTRVIFREMNSVLDFDAILRNSDTIFRRCIVGARQMDDGAGLDLDMPARESMDAEETSLFNAGFLNAMLLITLMPTMSDTKTAMCKRSPGFLWFSSRTGRIEILKSTVDGEKQLQLVLFPIPQMARELRRDARKQFMWSVNRESPEAKIQDFVAKSEDIIVQLRTQYLASQHRVLSFIAGGHDLWWRGGLVTSILLNLLSLLCYVEYTTEDAAHAVQTGIKSGCPVWLSRLDSLIGVMHLAFWALITLEFVFIQLPPRLHSKRQMEQSGGISLRPGSASGTIGQRGTLSDGASDQGPANPNAIDQALALALRFYSHMGELLERIASWEFRLIYHYVMTALSFVGLFWPPIYCVHLLDYIYRDQILQGVIASITMNWNSLSKTVLLGVIIVYIYGVTSFVFFRSAFDAAKGHHCDTLFGCFVTVLSYGVRSGGGIGEILSPHNSTEHSFVGRVILELSFFLIVIIFLLNVIFGWVSVAQPCSQLLAGGAVLTLAIGSIIFDTFGQLRDRRLAITNDMKNVCFICSIHASEFQRFGRGFEDHIANDHNLWHYLFFFVHLKLKDITEYTAQESYVAEMLAASDFSFFPIHRAGALKKKKVAEDQEDRARKINDRLRVAERNVGGLVSRLRWAMAVVLNGRPTGLPVSSFSSTAKPHSLRDMLQPAVLQRLRNLKNGNGGFGAASGSNGNINGIGIHSLSGNAGSSSNLAVPYVRQRADSITSQSFGRE